MTEARVNGSLLRGALKYVKHAGYPSGIQGLIERVPDDRADEFRKSFLPGSWYPYRTYGLVLETIDREVGRGDGTEIHRMGTYAAGQDAGTGFKIVRIFVSVAKVAAFGHSFWPRTVDVGSFAPIEHGDGFTRTELTDFPDVHPLHCRLLVGWFEGMCGLLGAKDARTTHTRCVHRGDSTCEFLVEWNQ